MAREASSGAASVPQASFGKVAFASSETQSAGGSQPPIDLKRLTFSADAEIVRATVMSVSFKRRRESSQYAHYNRRSVRLAFPRNVILESPFGGMASSAP
jgi:hypothetical protein